VLLRTYRAPDLATALAQARSELGPDALVLSTSEIEGGLGLTGVEVTVAALRNRPAAGVAARSEPPPPPRADEPPPGGRPIPAPPAALEAAVRALVASGVSQDLAIRFARIAARDLARGAGAAELAAATVTALEAIVPLAPLPTRSRCLFLVGPPGCGKTTTAAKLVTRAAAENHGPVFFAVADLDRVGALEEADIYARHAGATLARVDGPEDLARALADAGVEGTVVVDTSGVSARDERRLRRLEALRGSVPDAATAVILPAGLHREEASRILDRFCVFSPTCAGISRVDDGGRLGDLLTALAGAGLPLSFVTTGHRIPQDLEEVSAGSLALMLLSEGSRNARSANARP